MTDSEPVILSGRYELHSRIARGGMAEVYLARDQLLDRLVAIKVLFPEFAVDPSFVERFRREAQAAANLNHASIVGVFDWGSYESTYFIVMEYVRGRALSEILRAEGTLSPERAADIVLDIAGALSFAHRNGVVHRDVKPGNVLISPQGQVKVADFGIARAMSGSGDENLTQTGSVMGTATYFSPEQAQGLAVDPRSDLYSLGVVLYEMLAGRPPFSGEGPVAIAYKHVQEPPVPLRQLDPTVPVDLESICMKLLGKNPDDRYASAEDLRADIRRFRDGQPVLAQAVSNSGVTAATSAIPGLAGAALAGGSSAATRTNPYGQLRDTDGTAVLPGVIGADYPYEPPRRTAVFVAVLVGLLVVLGGLLLALSRVLGSDGGGSGSRVTHLVPNVVGIDYRTAQVQLEELKLVVRVERVKNVQVPIGQVITQNPLSGVKVEEGSTVVLTVSSADTLVVMPNLVGTTEADARKVLTGLGFTNVTATKLESNKPTGEVLEQTPKAGGQVEKSAPIVLGVSGGGKMITLPSVAGKTCDEARKAIVAAGVREAKVSCVDTPSVTVDKGKVIGTDPQGQVSSDGDVKVLVSSGPSKVRVPSVIGLTQSSAESQLLGAGLKVRVEFEPRADRIDRVINQSPSEGNEVDAGSTVTIVVGTAAAPTTTAAPAPTTTAPAPTTTAAPATTTTGA